MLCIVIKGPSFEEVYQQIAKAVEYADLVELRLDYFSTLDIPALKSLQSHFAIPMIFTLRSQLQGGKNAQSEDDRLADIRRLAALKPAYLDLENHVPANFIHEMTSQHPEIKLILTYHHFTKAPEDLDALYEEMRKMPAFFYKIAITACNSLDALRLLCWAKQLPSLIAISMGPYGQYSRILGSIIENPITYATLEDNLSTAPGQLPAKTLIERYRYPSLSPHTAIYGLIGDPVDLSLSDITHNALMHTAGEDAVYVKIQVKASELADFLQYAKQLPFRGLSVTMPLKECIIPYLDHIDTQALEIGAVNTLLFENGKIIGFNTDGIGALNAIEQQLCIKAKKVVIIGAGGAAKAIAYEAHRRGANVTIVNRDAEKARQLASRLQCASQGLEHMSDCVKKGYDILINCTPLPMPISCDHILPGTVVMDIKTKPMETDFLKCALEKKCRIIYGYKMFIEQAAGQFDLWFKDRINEQSSRTTLEHHALKCL